MIGKNCYAGVISHQVVFTILKLDRSNMGCTSHQSATGWLRRRRFKHVTWRMSRQQVEKFVQIADVVKASDDDIAWLYPDRPLLDVATAWLDGGSSLVVITKGSQGAMGVTRGPEVTESARACSIQVSRYTTRL